MDEKEPEEEFVVVTRTSTVARIIGGVFSSIGIILLILAAYFGNRSYTFLRTAVSVPGVVKEFTQQRMRNTRDNTFYTLKAPVLEYHYNGRDYTYESPYGTTEPAYRIGDQVPLLLDPARPDKPDEDSFVNNWFVTLLLGSIGLIFAGVGMIVIRAFNKPNIL